MSPIVARSVMKDPEQRAALFKAATTVPKEDRQQQARRSLGNIFRSAAAWHGVNTGKLAANINSGKLKMSNPGDVGIVQKEKKTRPGKNQSSSDCAPESMGLAMDDTFTFLTMMKR